MTQKHRRRPELAPPLRHRPRLPACLFAGLAALALGACDRTPQAAPPPAGPAASVPGAAPAASAPAVADGWLGRWTGPEGTYLEISRAELGGYALTIQNLDGPVRYAGHALPGGIGFTRNGQDETLRATDGQATGMKWLQEKKNCLTVRSGEGYCRD